jgi:CHC2 zinc finger
MRNYSTTELNSRPDILEVVGRYTSLRKVGRDFVGLSPCHSDRHPSLRVNADKQVWYCDPCAIGGDVIEFIKLIEGTDFKGALKVLGMDDGHMATVHSPARRQAKWVRKQISKMNFRIRELDEQLELADELGDVELGESLWNERRILADMRDDLSSHEYRADFVRVADVIENITKGFE